MLPGAAPSVLQKMQELQMSKSALKRLRKKQAMMEILSSVTHDDDGGDEGDGDAAAATGPSSSTGDVPTLEEIEEEEEEVDALDSRSVEKAPLAYIDDLQQLSQEGPTVEQQQHPSADIVMPVLPTSGTASTHMSHHTRVQVAAAGSVPGQVASLIRPSLNDGVVAASTATPLYSSQAVGPSLVQHNIIAMSPSYPHQPTLSSSVSSSAAQNNQFHLQLNSGGSSISTDNLIGLLIGKTEPSKPLIPLQHLDS